MAGRIVLLALAATLLTAAAAGESPPASEASPPAMEAGRGWTELFYQGKLEEIRRAFSPEMKEEFPLERLTAVRNQVLDQLGPEIEVHDETVREENGYTIYRRLVTFEKRRDARFEVLWTTRDDDLVAGFFVREAPQAQPD